MEPQLQETIGSGTYFLKIKTRTGSFGLEAANNGDTEMKVTHRLQLVESRRGNTVYEKFQAVFPREIIEACGWHQGDELHFRQDREGHVVVSAHPYTPKLKPEADYERIRLAVWLTLHQNPHGLRWTQIREKASVLPKKPSPFLVAKLINDIGLLRERDAKTGRKIWRIGEARLFPRS